MVVAPRGLSQTLQPVFLKLGVDFVRVYSSNVVEIRSLLVELSS
jgi:hypothetical protein